MSSITTRSINRCFRISLALSLVCLSAMHAKRASAQTAADPSATSAPSLQAELDAHPGQMIPVPPGDIVLTEKLRITGENGGLYGYGRIIQSNPSQPILEIEHAGNVRITGLTLTRAEGQQDATAPGILCAQSTNVILEDLRLLECRAREAAIELRDCQQCTVRDCEVINYKRIAVDDRTDTPLYGYAFFCIDGTGISVRESTGIVISGNRVIDTRLLPTPEIKDQYQLGKLTEGRAPSKEGALASDAFQNGCVNNWHQGSAILVTSPERTAHVSITGNYIENAAQGIDLHCDYAVCANNIVNHGMIGVKATHGSRNLIISSNTLTHIDLWGILLNPGAASHAAEPATEDKPAREPNVDAGTVIANNVITDFGRGHEFWNWGGKSEEHAGSYPIAMYEGQLPSNPPLRDVIVQGNMVYDSERDEPPADGAPLKPRYQYAVYMGPWGSGKPDSPTCPKDIHFTGNVFHPGTSGIANVPLPH